MFARSYFLLSAAAAFLAVPAQASMNISASPTKNVSCSASVCTPTNKGAVLNVTDLQNLLASSDVTVNTGAGAVTIEITAPLTWSSTHHLTLNADYNVSIRAPVAVEGTSGLSIACNNGGAGGQFQFFPGGKIDFWDVSSSFSVNGTSYVLVNDLATLANGVASDAGGAFAFAKDYDAGPDGTYKNTVVGPGFSGTFEGLGHTVSNLFILGTPGSAVGMFADTSQGPVLRDLALANVDIQAQRGSAGAFAGEGNFVTLFGVSSSGTIGGADYTGGLAGWVVEGGSITASHSSATVNGGAGGYTGGLIAVGEEVVIASSSFTGYVNGGPKGIAGGLAGAEGGRIVQSFSTAPVYTHGNSGAGGLVGRATSSAPIVDSYATGAVTAHHFSDAGGLIGYDAANVYTSYSTGAVNVLEKSRQKIRAGGFAGRYIGGGLVSDYFDIDTSAQSRPCANPCNAVKGLSDAALKSGLPSGFDPAVWAESPSINNGYPYLIANPPQ